MDLTIEYGGGILNVRVMVVLKTSNGLLLETHKKGYHFFPGGRVKMGESSLEAAKREMLEETGMNLESLKFQTILENFFQAELPVYEICYIYSTDPIPVPDEKYNLKEYTLEQIVNMDVRPDVVKKLILENKLQDGVNYISK